MVFNRVLFLFTALLFEGNSLKVLSPVQHSARMLIPPTQTTNVPLHFDLDSNKFATHVCFTLMKSSETIFEEKCVQGTENSLMLSSLGSGEYIISVHSVGEDLNISTHSVDVVFSIREMSEVLPPIMASQSPLFFIANDATSASDVSFQLNIEDHQLKAYLDICIEVICCTE